MKTRILVLLACVGCGVGGFLLANASAVGPPTTPNEALFYAGFITDDTNVPLDGDQTIELKVLIDSVGSPGGELCTTGPVTVPVDQGRFRMAVPDTCKAAFEAEPNTWVRLVVNGTELGATRVGAVPYALEAGRAVTATTADNATNAESALNADNATVAESANSVDYANVSNTPLTAAGIYQNPVTAEQFSLYGSPCQNVTAPQDGNLGGLSDAKTLCETTCGGSATAHMCTAEEIERFVATGGASPVEGWIVGTRSGSHHGSGQTLTGCQGFTTNQATTRGIRWTGGSLGQYPAATTCDNQLPVLCCD